MSNQNVPPEAVNPFFDKLLALRANDRSAFDGLPVETRLAVLEYEKGKRRRDELRNAPVDDFDDAA
jgi:hypothetical protein